jgi:hypothetical protein
MTGNETVRKIGFTGSTAVGKQLMAAAAASVKVRAGDTGAGGTVLQLLGSMSTFSPMMEPPGLQGVGAMGDA